MYCSTAEIGCVVGPVSTYAGYRLGRVGIITRRSQSRWAILNFPIDYIFFNRSPLTRCPPGNFPFSHLLPGPPPVRPSVQEWMPSIGYARGPVMTDSKRRAPSVYLSVRTQPARRRIKFGGTSDLADPRFIIWPQSRPTWCRHCAVRRQFCWRFATNVMTQELHGRCAFKHD